MFVPDGDCPISSMSSFNLTSDGKYSNHFPLDENNLIVKAYYIMHSKLTSVSKEYSIHVKKNIPIGSGLGGGSSNAATTLKVLNKLWSGSWGVYPNTGVSMPSKNGHIAEMVSDDEFSVTIKRYADMGANIVGACCGSTPETIGQIKKTLKHGSI